MVESTAAVEAEVEGWWAGDAEAGADVRTLAAKVAFLRAQRDGVRVELRELTRAFVGARGHGSAAAELEAGSQYARLSAALHKASTGLQLYQARLTSAQQAERSAIDDSRQQAVARRKDEEKQRVEAEKGAADEKSALQWDELTAASTPKSFISKSADVSEEQAIKARALSKCRRQKEFPICT